MLASTHSGSESELRLPRGAGVLVISGFPTVRVFNTFSDPLSKFVVAITNFLSGKTEDRHSLDFTVMYDGLYVTVVRTGQVSSAVPAHEKMTLK
jgi:hypothetical protein